MAARRIVLNFHGLGTPPAGEPLDPMWLEAEELEAVLDATMARTDVAVTFDDGFASDCELALPILAARDLRATFFVVADLVGRPGRLSGDGVRELAAAGMTIGSHGLTHRSWRELRAGELDEELRGSRAWLEDLTGAPVRSAACPLGRYDARVLRSVRRAGYAQVFTSDGGWAREGAWMQPRNTIRAGAARAVADRLRLGVLPYEPLRLPRLRLQLKRWR